MNGYQSELPTNLEKLVPGSPQSVSRRYLFLINPKSGQGKAEEQFARVVVPVIEDFVDYHIIVTDHAGHATEIARCLDIEKWDALVIVSGDGLVHEVFNGLVTRPDYEKALRFPIGVLPGGSGNALVTCMMHLTGGPTKINAMLPAAHLLNTFDTTLLNLVHVQSRNTDSVAFLSFGLGLLPDIDIESETLRLLGIVRFTIYAVCLCLKPRRYRVRLSYKLAPEGFSDGHVDENNNDLIDSGRPCVSHVNGHVNLAAEGSLSSLSGSANSGDSGVIVNSSPYPPASRVDRSRSTYQAARTSRELSESPSRSRPRSSHAGISLERCPVNRVKCLKAIDLKAAGSVDNPELIPSDLRKQLSKHDVIKMPPLTEPVPDDWVQEEDSYSLLFSSFVSHIGEDMLFNPNLAMHQDVMYLTIARRLTIRQLTQVCFALAPGKIQDLPFVKTIPVLAYRFEPLDEGPVPNIVVDGERLTDRGPIQVCCSRLASTILGVPPPPKYQ